VSSSSAPPSGWITVLAILLALVAVLLLHELVHGAFFWLITRSRPRFGLQITYAYAAAPDCYIPRNPYLVVGLSPLVLITLAGIVMLPLIPLRWCCRGCWRWPSTPPARWATYSSSAGF